MFISLMERQKNNKRTPKEHQKRTNKKKRIIRMKRIGLIISRAEITTWKTWKEDLFQRGDSMLKSKSMFHPYYNKIQALLFDGMTIKEAHEYMVKYFGLYSSYRAFYAYVKKQKLDWFMPIDISGS